MQRSRNNGICMVRNPSNKLVINKWSENLDNIIRVIKDRKKALTQNGFGPHIEVGWLMGGVQVGWGVLGNLG